MDSNSIFPLCDLAVLEIWKRMNHTDILKSLRQGVFPYRAGISLMYLWLTIKGSKRFISDLAANEYIPDLLSKRSTFSDFYFAELISFCPTCDDKLSIKDKSRLEKYCNLESVEICVNGCFVCQECQIDPEDSDRILCIYCQDKGRCVYCKAWDDDPSFEKCSKCQRIVCDECVCFLI